MNIPCDAFILLHISFLFNMHLLNVGLHATPALNLWRVCKAEDHLGDISSLFCVGVRDQTRVARISLTPLHTSHVSKWL